MTFEIDLYDAFEKWLILNGNTKEGAKQEIEEKGINKIFIFAFKEGKEAIRNLLSDKK